VHLHERDAADRDADQQLADQPALLDQCRPQREQQQAAQHHQTECRQHDGGRHRQSDVANRQQARRRVRRHRGDRELGRQRAGEADAAEQVQQPKQRAHGRSP